MYQFRAHPIVKWASACLCVLLAAPGLQAQDRPSVPAGPLTLEQVLQFAESRSEAIAISQSAVRRAEGEQIRARSGLLPQLSATASYDRLLASEFDGVFDSVSFGDDTGGNGADGGLEDLPFGRKNTWRATLSLSQNLYSGGRNGTQMALAAAGRDSAQLGVTTTRAQLLFDVTQAYYDAVLSDQLVTIAEATLEQAGATLKQTQAGFDAGTQPEFEVLRARVSRDNQSPVVIRQRVNRDLALLRLKQLLELPADADLQLADRLSDDALPPPPPFAVRVASVESTLKAATPGAQLQDAPLPERTAIAEAASTVRLRELALKLAEVQRRPSVSLNANYGRIAYPGGAFPEFERANSSIGVSVQVPILTGGRQRGDEAVARADLEQSRAQLQQTQELAALDTRSAWAELVAARAAWEATAGTVQQASRAYEIAEVRYRAGVSTQLELSDSRLLLQQAEANRAQAARDLQVARARVALLPDLPLGGSGGGGQAAPASIPSTPAPQQTPGGGGQLRNASAQGAQTQAGTQ